MKTLSVEQQVALLRPTVGFAAHMHLWLLAGAALSALAALALWNPVPLMLALFLGVVGLSERRAGPNVHAAVVAYDSGTASTGTASISVSSWSDTDTYHATVREHGHPDWAYEFIPQGWRPEVGTWSARIWRSGEREKPVLVAVDAGILIPRYDPKVVGDEGRSGPA